MTSIADKNSEFLSALSSDLTNAYNVAIGYFIGLYIQNYVKKYHCDFAEPIRNTKLFKFLDDCNLPHNLPTRVYWDWAISGFTNDDGDLDHFYINLERKFYEAHIDNFEDSQSFFSSVGYGYIVQNWEAFHTRYKGKENASFFEALTIAVCLRINQVYPDASEHWNEITDMFGYSLQLVNISNVSDFSDLMRIIFDTKLHQIPVSVNGQIHRVKRVYSKFYVTYNQLLEDYATIKLSSTSIKREPLNPWLNLNKKSNPNIESGISVAESLFNTGAYTLKDEAPLDLLNSVFYSAQSRNDSAFEVGFLAPSFYSDMRLSNAQEALVINPSPDFIKYWYANYNDMQVTFAVPHNSISDLYNYQFHTKQFIPFKELENTDKLFDGVLIMSRDWEKVEELLPMPKCITSGAIIYAVFPNAWLDGDYEDVNRKEAVFQEYRIQEVILVDSAAVNTVPRKKSLFVMRKDSFSPTHTVKIRNSIYSKETQRFYIEKNCAIIQHSEFIKATLSLISLKRNLDTLGGGATHYKAAQVYHFSKEIQIHYSILPGRKNRYAGMADFREILDSKKKGARIKGKRLTERIEKGLRATTEAAVIHQIETRIPYDERVEPHVISEIFRVYRDKMVTVSLKTMWYVLRSNLKQNKEYDDNLCKTMFDPEVTDLHQLYVDKAHIEDYAKAMESLIDVDSLTRSMPYWKQLHILFSQIVSHGYYNANPIAELFYQLKKSATVEQQEVRNALTKKTFTEIEESRIFDYLMEEDSQGRKYSVTDSFRIASAIRFYTGMDIREICALTWADFRQITGTECYQLCVTKFVTANGELTTDCRSETKKFRRVPLSPVVSELILHRQEYLNSGPENIRAAANMPIISPKGAALIKHQVVFCKPGKVAAKCKELLNAADIPEQILILPDENGNDIVTDIYKYYGDIFKSNFKYRANHTCKLRRGEINYILGIEAPDTFSKHYCDYMNDSVQAGMVKKIYRWETIHPNAVDPISQFNHIAVTGKKQQLKIGPFKSKTSSDTILFAADAKQDEIINLDVICKHGLECIVTRYFK